jgi:ABC-type nickel/cobalt efflux system permease component RcnA
MKVAAAIAIVALAVIIGVVPQYTHCRTGAAMVGSHMTESPVVVAAPTAQPMHCYWSARAEIGVSVPLALAAVLLALSRRRESRRFLALLTSALGAVAILVPTVLIGVCQTPTAVCRTTMRPTLLAAGGLVVVLGLVILVVNQLRSEDEADHGADAARAAAAPHAPGTIA